MSIFRRRYRCEPMPRQFGELADYNSRVSKGVRHTAEYDARMAALQGEFDAWRAEANRREGIVMTDAEGER